MTLLLCFGFLASVEVAILTFMSIAGRVVERDGPHSRAAKALLAAALMHWAWMGFLTLLAAASVARRLGG